MRVGDGAVSELDKFDGLKRADITPCIVCDKGMMHDNNISFYRITAQHFIADLVAIQRRHGHELMMGGGSAGAMLAEIMGPGEDLAKAPSAPETFLICQPCALLNNHSIIAMLEHANDRRKPEDAA